MIRFNCPNCGRHYELPDALASLPLVCKQCGQRITPPAPSPEPPPPPPKPVAPPPAPPPAAPKSVAVPAPAPKPAAPKPALPPKPVESPKPAPAPVAAPKPAPAAPPPAPATPQAAPPTEPDDVLVAKPDASPDIDFNIGGPTAASLSEATRARPTGLADVRRSTPDLSNVFGPGGDSIPDLNLDLLPPAPPLPPPRAAPAPAPPEPPPEKPESTALPFFADLGAFVLLVVGGLFLGEFLVRKPMGTVLSEAGAAPKFPPVDLLLLLGPPVMFGLIYLLLGSRERTLGAWLRRRRNAGSTKLEERNPKEDNGS